MTCCECVPTPQSILDDDEIDVFDAIIPEDEVYRDAMCSALWNTYRFRGIGNCNMAYWIQTMKDRYELIKYTYWVKFKAVGEWLEKVMDPDALIDMADSETTYETVSETEDNPDNPQGDTVYLSDRNKVRYAGKSYGGLSSETLRRFNDAVVDIEQEFADEFRRQFYYGV